MKILIDADACPVIQQAENLAKKYGLSLLLVCDTSHMLSSKYGKVIHVDKGPDSADFRLISLTDPGDILVTQDYGVAAMALGKRAFPIHQSGKLYTDDNIDQLLMERHIAKTERRKTAKHHLKGPSARTPEDNKKFEDALEALIRRVLYL